MVLRAVAANSLGFSRVVTRGSRLSVGVRHRIYCAAHLRRLVAQTRSSGAFLSALSHCAAEDEWHALRMRRATGVAPKLEVDSRRDQCELNKLHLTNRSSQPLAAVMPTFNFMKQFLVFATLAAASGGSAPSR